MKFFKNQTVEELLVMCNVCSNVPQLCAKANPKKKKTDKVRRTDRLKNIQGLNFSLLYIQDLI